MIPTLWTRMRETRRLNIIMNYICNLQVINPSQVHSPLQLHWFLCLLPFPSLHLSICWKFNVLGDVGGREHVFQWGGAWRVCLRRTCVFLTGAGIGAIQAVPITGAFPAYWTSFIQERSSVAPAAQTRLCTERFYLYTLVEHWMICSIGVCPSYLEAVFKLLTDKVEGNWVDAGV